MNARIASALLLMALPTSVLSAPVAEPGAEAPPASVEGSGDKGVAIPAGMPSPPVRVPPPIAMPGLEGVGGSGLETGTVAEAQWLSDPVELRVPTAAAARTNRVSRTRGALPGAARTERKGVGGFFAGLAGLFNPLAPMERGVAVQPAHTYDGQLQPAPLPRGFRDERYHEPRVELLLVDFEPVSRPRSGSGER